MNRLGVPGEFFRMRQRVAAGDLYFLELGMEIAG